jgi:hypothetical protein
VKEVDYIKYLIDGELDDFIRVRFWIEKGKLLDLVIQYESIIDGKIHPIVRYDCSHGFFHRDILLPKEEKIKKKIPIANLESAAKYAQQDIEERWTFYLERYLKHLRK